ncbi:MAG: redoxin domain-containing protein, partial [Terriglobia bacterium]
MKDKVTGVVLALLALALFAALEVPHPHSESPQVGEEAPNFTFRVNERTQELRDLRGQVVVLNFWATWCPPC